MAKYGTNRVGEKHASQHDSNTDQTYKFHQYMPMEWKTLMKNSHTLKKQKGNTYI